MRQLASIAAPRRERPSFVRDRNESGNRSRRQHREARPSTRLASDSHPAREVNGVGNTVSSDMDKHRARRERPAVHQNSGVSPQDFRIDKAAVIDRVCHVLKYVTIFVVAYSFAAHAQAFISLARVS